MYLCCRRLLATTYMCAYMYIVTFPDATTKTSTTYLCVCVVSVYLYARQLCVYECMCACHEIHNNRASGVQNVLHSPSRRETAVNTGDKPRINYHNISMCACVRG